jgi:hypothetical protein
MKDIHGKKQLVAEFLNGEMKPEKIAWFETMCRKDMELQELLEKNATMDALLYEQHSTCGNEEKYPEMVDALLFGNEVMKKSRRVSFWLRAYAVAATLLVVLSGGLLLQKNITRQSLKRSDAEPVRIPGSHPIPQSGKSITRITSDAVLISEEGTRARVVSVGDTATTVIVAQGNVSLDVKGTSGGAYTVVTPHTAVTLHGTVVRVVVTELETEINVLEGSVEVVHRYNTDVARELHAGHIVFADSRSLETETRLTPEVCNSRKNLLRAYVQWVQEQKNG